LITQPYTPSVVHAALGPSHSIYAGTKDAINSFTRDLAVELLPVHVRASVVAPGTIEVPNYFRRYEGYTREAGNTVVPWGRVGEPKEVGFAGYWGVMEPGSGPIADALNTKPKYVVSNTLTDP